MSLRESPASDTGRIRRSISRRQLFGTVACAAGSGLLAPALAAEIDESFTIVFKDGPIGLELMDAITGGGAVLAPCSALIKEILPNGQASKYSRLKPGLGISLLNDLPVCGGQTAKEVAGYIKSLPRPLAIRFTSKRVVAEEGAEGKRFYGRQAETLPAPASKVAGTSSKQDALVVKRLTQPRACGMISRENDLLEIRYTARVASDMREYDSSDRRGTGQPLAITLGRGDVVKGLDLSLYDMCIGERRRVEVPSGLAYGERGRPQLGVPPNSNLVFGVQLVSINGIADPLITRDGNFYTGDPCSEESIASGMASGFCSSKDIAVPQ